MGRGERSARWLGALLAAASGIHLAVTRAHFDESFLYGGFFLGLAVVQAAMAVRALTESSRTVLRVVGSVNASVVVLWIVSRTVGLPFGTEPWTREAVGFADLASTAIEVAVVILALFGSRSAARNAPSAGLRTRAFAGAVGAAFAGAVFTSILPAEAHDHGHVATAAREQHEEHLHSLRVPGERDPGPDRRKGSALDGRSISVGRGPSAVAYLDGSIWVANRIDGSLTQVDAATSTSRTINVGSKPSGIAALNHQLWVTRFGDDTVVRLDRRGKRIGRPIDVGAGPIGIAAAPSGVWVTSSTNGTVQRIDPSTGQVGKPIAAGFGTTAVAAAGGDVWVTNTLDRTVVRIDARDQKVLGSPIPVGAGAAGLVIDGDSVWVVAASDGTVLRVSRTRRVVTQIVRVDDRTSPGQGPTGLTLGCGSLWVANNHDKTVIGVDPLTASAGEPLFYDDTLGSYPAPVQVVCAGDALWVSDYDTNSLARIPARKE